MIASTQKVKRVALSSVTDYISKGTTPTTVGFSYEPAGIPFVRVNNLVDRFIDTARDILFISEEAHEVLRRSLILPGDVLLAIAGTIGRASIVPPESPPLNCNQAVCIIRCSTELDAGYLRYWLASEDAQRQIATSKVTGVIANLSLTEVRQLAIPLPPISEQRRIAAILEKADALRAKRRLAITKLDQLLQSVFLEMFGDPVTNPKGWPVHTVGNVFSDFVGGQNILCPDDGSSDFRILKVSAVTSTTYRPDESKGAPQDFVPDPDAIVRQGDILFSRANTTELVAATAYVWETPKNLVLPDKLWRMQIREGVEAEPLFLWELLKSKSFRHELSKRSSGTSGSMKNISKGKLKTLPMPLPGRRLQETFATICRAVQKQKIALSDSLECSEALFATIQKHAFC